MASVVKKGRAVRTREGLAGGWLATAIGVVFLVAAGFGLGMVAGVVSEEPELVAGHLAGRSETIDWAAAEGAGEDGKLPAVSAAGSAAEFAGEAQAGPSIDLPVLGEVSERSAGSEFAAAPEVKAAPPAKAAPVRVAKSIAAPTAAKSQGKFGVQVGAFAKGTAAESMADDLRGRGYPVVVVPSAGASDRRWRVRVGPVGTRGEADALARKLQQTEQLPTWVLSDVAG